MSRAIPDCRALSIRQPWLELILSGRKPVENRTWEPPERLLGQRIWLHASARRDADVELPRGTPRPAEELPLGAIVGSAVIEKVVTRMRSPWFQGPFGWLLSDVRRLRSPVPCLGRLGLWLIPLPVLREVESAS